MSTKTFRLPDLGEGLTEATLMHWLVEVGDAIEIDQPIAEVETAKSVVEVPSPFAGTVAVLHGAEGELLLVGAPFVEVGDADGVAESASSDSVDVEAEAYRAEEQAGSGNVLIGFGTKEAHTGGRKRRPRGTGPGWLRHARSAGSLNPRRRRLGLLPCGRRSSGSSPTTAVSTCTR